MSSAVEIPIRNERLIGVSTLVDTNRRWVVVKPKHQRLILALVAVVALSSAGFIAAAALREEASYFYTPTTLVKAQVAPGKAVRLGGMVQKNSIVRAKDGVSISFIVQDQAAIQKVVYRGITPDLFVEGSGVVADGRLRADGVFVAESLLAKHDENYVPKELADIDMNAAEHTKDTIAK
jgi:cytochrome c-type biogenesis protein CcmE